MMILIPFQYLLNSYKVPRLFKSFMRVGPKTADHNQSFSCRKLSTVRRMPQVWGGLRILAWIAYSYSVRADCPISEITALREVYVSPLLHLLPN